MNKYSSPSVSADPGKWVSRFCMALLFAFLLAFPKAGFKVAEVPVTFGYIFLVLIGAISTVIGLANGRLLQFRRSQISLIFSLIPLQAFSLLCLVAVGSLSTAYTVAFLVSFLVLPFIFLFCLKESIFHLDPFRFSTYLRRSVNFVALYGIFLFVWRIQVGSFIEIPFLTVNADDVGQLDTKNIDRGAGIIKLISTYNNGNIFGVCMLMLIPLYDAVASSRLMKILLRLSLLLTLSRTVWLGLVFYEIFSALCVRRSGKVGLLVLLFSIASLLIGISTMVSYLGKDVDFIFDTNLGGRADTLFNTQVLFLPNSPVAFPSDIIYVNVLSAFGVTGLLAFCIAMFAPVILVWRQSRKGEFRRAIALGMLMFLVCGLSDGPMLLIPVMAIYWALAALGLSSIKSPDKYSAESAVLPLVAA